MKRQENYLYQTKRYMYIDKTSEREIMAQIELPNGIKITLDSEEVLAVLRHYKAQSPAHAEETKKVNAVLIPPTTIPPEVSVPATVGKFPTVGDLAKSLEDKGFPFTHTLFEEFVNRFQTTPRQNVRLYGRFRDAMKTAEEQLAIRHKGNWKSESVMIDKKPSRKFWLVRNEIENMQESTNRY